MANPPLNSVGEILRKAREKKRYSHDDVNKHTKISLPVLQALEQDDFDSFESDTYLKGFLKNYASFLQLDFELLNTTLERQKGRNMQANPKVTVLVIDPKDTSRWIEVRGKVAGFSQDEAEAHADKLTQLYTGKQHFYGDIYPTDQKQKETRVIARIEPIKISLDVIFR